MTTRPAITLNTPAQVMDATIGAMTIGLVPIMGTIHAGHLALIQRAVLENDETVVAIIDPSGDVPEITAEDVADVRRVGARIFYRPAPEDIFPPDFATSVRVPTLAASFEGEARKGHFDRVAALFVILLNQLQPTRTYVGEKHLQQLSIIQRIHRDLSLSGTIVPCVTVRDPDGLPLSSYNATLSADERAAAIAIPQALLAMQFAASHGEHDAEALLRIGQHVLEKQPLLTVDYLAIVDPATFQSESVVETGQYAIFGGMLGTTRLLDCVHLETGGTG